LNAGARRTGSGKFGLFKRAGQQGGKEGPHCQAGGPADPHAGRHAGPRRQTTRKRVGKVVPAAAVAATLAAGAAAYALAGGGGLHAAQLADVAQPASLSGAAHVGISTADTDGRAEAAASAAIRVVKTATASVARQSARAQDNSRPRAAAKPSATPATAGTAEAATAPPAPAAAPTPTATATATAAPTPAPTPTASSSSTAAATTLSCNLSDGLLPDNVTAIVSFLLAHGYSDNAAAGIAGNMYQESKGNPESEGDGGGGLIGFTPLPSGYVTGNPAVDLQTQLAAVLTYNQQWASYLPELNSAATPADAADVYVTDFERAGIPAASTREASAQAVAESCGI
jgi:hypothetical protein